jgi:hypothetical protein
MFRKTLSEPIDAALIAAMCSSLSKALADRRALGLDGARRAAGTYGVILPRRTHMPPTLPMGVSAPPDKSRA